MNTNEKYDNFAQAMKMGVGTNVRTLVDFVNVPKGTYGVIIDDYGTGFMVEWITLTKPVVGYKPLKDGFNKATELQYLEIIN